MRFCKECVMPDTKPDLSFDKKGVCDACRSAELKNKIDWKSRKKELVKILDKYRSKDDSNYDCIIPVSGGKDSHYQVYLIKEEFGMNPLCVTFAACKSTKLGKKNLQNLRELGVDHILFTANPRVYRRLFKLGFEKVGDPCWPCHVGIFTVPIQVAVRYKVPLIIWGENPQLEYGGPASAVTSNTLDRKWLQTFGGLLGLSTEDLTKHGFLQSEINPYVYPSDEEINKVGVTGLFLGYYIKWDARKQVEIMKKHGFRVHDGPERGTYTNYENLDCGFTGVHDYFKYVKYGFGRATDHACIDVRNDRMTRKEALKIVNEYDGRYDNEECRKELGHFLDFIGVTEEEFRKTVNKFRGKNAWKKKKDIWLLIADEKRKFRDRPL